MKFNLLQLDTPTTPSTQVRDKVKQQQTGMEIAYENESKVDLLKCFYLLKKYRPYNCGLQILFDEKE